MKIKEHSMQIRKTIAVLLHFMGLILALAGISFMYLNMHYGQGLLWLRTERYEDTQQFSDELQGDISNIFKYVSTRDIFEDNGMLDMSMPILTVTFNNSENEMNYSLDDMVRYAKSQGFYLDANYDLVSDAYVYDDSSANKPRVIWYAFSDYALLDEPGAAYVSLRDLSIETLRQLSEYYKVYYNLIVNPSNLSFQICYQADDGEQSLYTNAPDMSVSTLKGENRKFFFLSGDSIIMDTNLRQVPNGITSSLENYNPYGSNTYYMIVSVDTTYPIGDSYSFYNTAYQSMRRAYLEGVGYLAAGLIGMLLSLIYLVMSAGFKTSEKVERILLGFDMISTESCIAFTALAVMFGLFLGEKIAYKLLHLLVTTNNWGFAERVMRAVIIYVICLVSVFSLIRRYRSGLLWKNSMMYQFFNNLQDYNRHSGFCANLLLKYSFFTLAQLVGVSLIWFSIRYWQISYVKWIVALLGIGIIVLDYLVFNALFSNAIQRDQIAEAVDNIASGDTAYQVDLTQFSGKELELASSLNSIGTGLEHALSEQVKSERLKADLITNVSHDIKTPLTSIINYVDLIKREHIQDPKVQSYISVLEQKSQRLKTLTEDLVEASKASSGNIKLEIANIDLVEMIYQTNGEFEEKYQTRNLEIVSNLPENSIIIEADGRHLWRVLENLYNNAYKYAMQNSRVYVDVTQDEDHATFTIKNVSESPLNIKGTDLTERFVRGDVSRTTEGSGLGLSIASSLTTLQKGVFDIQVDGDLFKASVTFAVKKEFVE